jgi:hypothetical protein
MIDASQASAGLADEEDAGQRLAETVRMQVTALWRLQRLQGQ